MLCRRLLESRLRCLSPLSRVASHSTTSGTVRSPQSHWHPFGFQKLSPDYSEDDYDAREIAMRKRAKIAFDLANKRRNVVNPAVHLREGTNDEVLELEVEDLLKAVGLSDGEKRVAEAKHSKSISSKPPIELQTEVELDIVELSSTGDGLAYTPEKDSVVVVPFSVPGDRVRCKPFRWTGHYLTADFISVVKPSTKRDGVTPKCKYFASCGGCQLQMIPYVEQLAHKKTIVEKAFNNFSGLSAEQMPSVLDTMGSPLQYSYRTKLSPHFDGPSRRKITGFTSIPDVGYNKKNSRKVIDIEHCPIGTDILQEGLKLERAKVAVNYQSYARGKTILLRESTQRDPDDSHSLSDQSSAVADFDTISKPSSTDLHQRQDGRPEITLTFPNHKEYKTYTSVETSASTEYVGPHKFVNQAGSFFQNNNSILGPFTKYVYDNCLLPASKSDSSTPPIKYLLDAYCGSGLFTITLSKLFSSALGIDIDSRGIAAARLNAHNNNIPNAGFIEADASDLFADVPFPPDQSLVIIDPPRRGASEDFLRQLCSFGAKRVIYVSCNVHTQARDVGMIVKGFGEGSGCRYEIESLRGFDFFPQTSHVEGVCVLNRVD